MAWKKKRRIKAYRTILIVLFLAAIIVMYNYFEQAGGQFLDISIIPDLQTKGYSLVSVDAAVSDDRGYVTLTSDCRQIVASVEAYQAESIYQGLQGFATDRPNSHDIITDAFDSLGVKVLMVKITEVKNNAFYGRMIVKSGNNIANLDARPSDATAIAIRVDAPVYVNDDLLEEYGEYIC